MADEPQKQLPVKPTAYARIFKNSIERLADLSIYARWAYVLLVAQVNKAAQVEVCFPCTDAQKHMSVNTWRKAVEELRDAGFITIKPIGGGKRFTNQYHFTDPRYAVESQNAPKKKR